MGDIFKFDVGLEAYALSEICKFYNPSPGWRWEGAVK